MQRLLTIAVALAACACTSMDVRTESAPDADFSDCRTYAWLADEVSGTGNPRVNDALLHMIILGAVEQELVARGFERKQWTDEPDLLVVYHAAVDRAYDGSSLYGNDDYKFEGGVDVPVVGFRPSGSTLNAPDTQVSSYQQGTLILDFMDGETREIVWRGSAQAKADLKASPEKRRSRVEKAVRLILDEFPVAR
jgi:hypothetical protein